MHSAPSPAKPESLPTFVLDRFLPAAGGPSPSRSFLATSTAPENVEDPLPAGLRPPAAHLPADEEARLEPRLQLDPLGHTEALMCDLAATLCEGRAAGPPEVVIAVHGFNTLLEGAFDWYERIHSYLPSHPDLRERNVVFIGYRWPSEKPLSRPLQDLVGALTALPNLPRGLAAFTLAVAIASLVVLRDRAAPLLLLLAVLATFLLGVIAALVLERIFVYFRDSSRASLYGSPDLVELVRQLDRTLDEAGLQEVSLSFLGHSLGASVITNALRVLADAFEPQAVGGLKASDPERRSTGRIGRCLHLGQLVLVAPDIPVESVIPRRANVLASALRRVREAHVFSSEGDLALRLASTAANYFVFPSRFRFSGYRLGNLTARHFGAAANRSGRRPVYGLVPPFEAAPEGELPAWLLEIRASDAEHRNLTEEPFAPWVASTDEEVTNRISTYDCTDVLDIPATTWGEADPAARASGLLTRARQRSALNLLEYAYLLFAYLRFSLGGRGGIDTHGGYFRGEATQEWIYLLAFTGFAQLKATLARSPVGGLVPAAEQLQLQLVLSPRERQELGVKSASSPPLP